MVENLALTKLIFDLFEIDAKWQDPGDFLSKFSDRLKETFSIDEVYAKASQQKHEMTPVEEYTVNTSKLYIDNRLSGYSAFADLINYYNSGFKSCAVVPIMPGSRFLGVLTLLSKSENRFGNETADALMLVSNIFGYQLLAKVEKEKSVSLAKYFDASFNSIIPQALIDSSGSFVKVNKAMMLALDKDAKNLIGAKFGSVFAIDAKEMVSLRGGIEIETRLVGYPDKIFRVSGNAINSGLMHITAYDVTEQRKLADEAMIFEHNSSEALLMLDNNLAIKWVSGNISRVIGHDAAGIFGKRLNEILSNGDRFAEGIGNLSGNEYLGTHKLILDNNIEVNVKITAFRNNFYGISCIIANNALEEYQKSIEKNLNELIEMSGDAIISIDELGYIKFVNKSAEALLGYKSSELTGTALSLLYADSESQSKLNDSLNIARREGSANNVFATMVAKGKADPIPCEQSIRRVMDSSGKLSGYIIASRELATKRLVEQLYDENEKLAKEAGRFKSEGDLKTQFIYNISHDLKTPITNIKGFSRLIYSGEFGTLNNEQKEYLKIILDESDRLMQLIQQILDVAKLSSDKIKLDLQQVSFAKLGENPSIKSLAEVAYSKGLMFSWEVDYNVPEVLADPNRLIQVLVNLIGNAIKFTEHGSISVKVHRKGRNVRVEVKDTGIGISKDDQRKLFKKFFQVPKKGLTKQEGAGTGLGLSIAKEIIRLHGGRISVNSEPGKGSEFWFTVPVYGKKKNKQA